MQKSISMTPNNNAKLLDIMLYKKYEVDAQYDIDIKFSENWKGGMTEEKKWRKNDDA